MDCTLKNECANIDANNRLANKPTINNSGKSVDDLVA